MRAFFAVALAGLAACTLLNPLDAYQSETNTPDTGGVASSSGAEGGDGAFVDGASTLGRDGDVGDGGDDVEVLMADLPGPVDLAIVAEDPARVYVLSQGVAKVDDPSTFVRAGSLVRCKVDACKTTTESAWNVPISGASTLLIDGNWLYAGADYGTNHFIARRHLKTSEQFTLRNDFGVRAIASAGGFVYVSGLAGAGTASVTSQIVRVTTDGTVEDFLKDDLANPERIAGSANGQLYLTQQVSFAFADGIVERIDPISRARTRLVSGEVNPIQSLVVGDDLFWISYKEPASEVRSLSLVAPIADAGKTVVTGKLPFGLVEVSGGVAWADGIADSVVYLQKGRAPRTIPAHGARKLAVLGGMLYWVDTAGGRLLRRPFVP